MSKIFLSAVLGLALTSSAFAADLPSRKAPAVAAVPVDPAFNWTGFYAGVNLGGAFDRTFYTFTAAGTSANHNGSGLLGGAQLGYNYQFANSNFVLGAELSADLTNLRGNTICPAPSAGFTCGHKDSWLGNSSVRVGYAFDRVLAYAKGGVALGSMRVYDKDLAGVSYGSSKFRARWTLGAGLAYAIDKNWSMFGEYEYAHHNVAGYTVDAGKAVRQRSNINIFKVGVNYRY